MPALGVDEAAHHLEEGRLAGAVGAEQRHGLAGGDGEVDAEEHLHLAVGEVDAADVEGGDGGRGGHWPGRNPSMRR